MPRVTRQKQLTTSRQLDDGTLEEDREDVFVYVHCYNQGCLKYHNLQENLNFERKVPGIREEVSFTYADRGGDMPGVENTHVNFYTQDGVHECDACNEQLNVSGIPSVKLAQYGIQAGTGLKGAERSAALAAEKANEANAGRDGEIASLKSQLEQLTKLTELALKKKD